MTAKGKSYFSDSLSKFASLKEVYSECSLYKSKYNLSPNEFNKVFIKKNSGELDEIKLLLLASLKRTIKPSLKLQNSLILINLILIQLKVLIYEIVKKRL